MGLDVKKFYKRPPMDILMFGYVSALMSNIPIITLEKSLLNFFKYLKVDEEIMNIESARITYYRMQKEYTETLKTNG